MDKITRQYICSVLDCLQETENLVLGDYYDTLDKCFILWSQFWKEENRGEMFDLDERAADSLSDAPDGSREVLEDLRASSEGVLLGL